MILLDIRDTDIQVWGVFDTRTHGLKNYHSYFIKTEDGQVLMKAQKHVRIRRMWAMNMLKKPGEKCVRWNLSK